MALSQQRDTVNFLVPAQGNTQVLKVNLPTDGTGPVGALGNYEIDWKSLNIQQLGIMFVPQACTIDASALTTDLTFTIPALDFDAKILAGQVRTFQFPAITDLAVQITADDASSPSFSTFWYNYPALPDAQGGVPSVSVTTLGTVRYDGATTANDQSVAAPAHAAQLLATIALNSNRVGFLIQNQSADQLQVSLDDGAGGNEVILLLEPAGANAGGDSVDMTGIQHWGRIRVYGPNAGAQCAVAEW